MLNSVTYVVSLQRSIKSLENHMFSVLLLSIILLNIKEEEGGYLHPMLFKTWLEGFPNKQPKVCQQGSNLFWTTNN